MENEINIIKLINSLNEVIPKHMVFLRNTLERIKKNYLYHTNPEEIEDRWWDISYILEEQVNFPPYEDWEYKVVALWRGQDLEDVEQEYLYYIN